MTVYRKKFDETKNCIYYANTIGQFYSVNKQNGMKHLLKPFQTQGHLNITVNHKQYVCKNLIARLFIEGTRKKDIVEQINDDPYDFTPENLRVITMEEHCNRHLVKYQKERSARLKEGLND